RAQEESVQSYILDLSDTNFTEYVKEKGEWLVELNPAVPAPPANSAPNSLHPAKATPPGAPHAIALPHIMISPPVQYSNGIRQSNSPGSTSTRTRGSEASSLWCVFPRSTTSRIGKVLFICLIERSFLFSGSLREARIRLDNSKGVMDFLQLQQWKDVKVWGGFFSPFSI
ncbi:LOW QUALITY PROTEIN: hypothetical protein BC937DRAFT_91086, partial [Endogone sp. FLAS-F59071]